MSEFAIFSPPCFPLDRIALFVFFRGSLSRRLPFLHSPPRPLLRPPAGVHKKAAAKKNTRESMTLSFAVSPGNHGFRQKRKKIFLAFEYSMCPALAQDLFFLRIRKKMRRIFSTGGEKAEDFFCPSLHSLSFPSFSSLAK